MARALDLAWRGWGRVHPNPLVGAVVLAQGEPVAEGWHTEYGGPHAEAAALGAAGPRARGATLVVTLEPCAHQGKQPPCTDAIRNAGIGRVVAATADPNPAAAGGAARLRSAGIEVELGLLGDRAAAQNAAFLRQATQADLPFVALKLATSVDARIADAGGRSRWLSGAEARGYVHWLRAGFDAIAIGGRTARRDDPSLTVRGPLTPRVAPRRVVFDRGAALSPDLTLVRTAPQLPTILVTSPDAPSERVLSLERIGVTVVPADELFDAARKLRSLGVGSLLVEGGGRLAALLLGAELVDRLYWIQCPLWLGEYAAPAFSGVPDQDLEMAPRWRAVERRPLGDDTLLVLDRPRCLPGS